MLNHKIYISNRIRICRKSCAHLFIQGFELRKTQDPPEVIHIECCNWIFGKNPWQNRPSIRSTSMQGSIRD